MFRGASFLLLLNWVCIVSWLISSFDSTTATIVVLATNDTFVDRTAAFGPRIPDEGIVLNLIAIETLDPSQGTTACHPLPIAPSTNGSWAALVERGGDCSFVDKVRNMQASGAKAVVVGDNQRSGLITMYAREDASDILTPSVFIAQHHYRELRYFGNQFGKEFLIKLTPDDLNWPLLDVVIFIILSPAFVVLFLYFLWRVRIRQQHIADLASSEAVTNLPIKVFYTSKLKENEPVECVICLEEFEDETELRVLPCKHEYHVVCIDSWLTTRKRFCPICKRDICTATESTPLLRSIHSRSSSNRHSDYEVPEGPYRAAFSANIPSQPSSSDPTASSSTSSSSVSGARIASSWPLRTAGIGRSGPGIAAVASAGSRARPSNASNSGAPSSHLRDPSSDDQVFSGI
ncbi:hypothetical protein BX616_008350 [Lobosporangium transversale]|uniref:RING-type domain-containing protein n=1 Tax=Lobosporangium transversale TaxID=64571 RepID=A0A1Y2GLL5_9FUNG|nr:hypothetical protein BCR41DRAFT_354308 [Lobosporangium transversale]KAF9918505.1 hypothetical protein BX616_008350 [Lobosporangium transversale]ORZ14906.1 hypothetical protein BCR41DRAFT_354308 [Lobosporangium transversale]|eukprot:XP_021881038.1 hypothetical protein BCR41DRAFT_354308 [Lobosporangium transversale]